MPDSALAGDGRQLRHGLVSRIRGRLFPLAGNDAMVLERACSGYREAPRNLRLSAAGHDRPVEGASARARPGGGRRCAARDEGLAYARHLDAAGVDTTVVRYENLIHDYG